ncbi:ferrous iron transport protein B [Gottschalkia purinilytica]|uniref:Ferrous iron transport protein B n=1 Tax=Gottschalkia purinilytica TaxID=1503 RepID=A0A0L0W8H7_GOTPU|nr:ferrous iron transport protein B [Gottschalkia purinilytica]KNF07849.1 ferrous iron transport protein B [Gottschalkia purinilytica]
MSCHGTEELLVKTKEDEFKILLMGNPNVGKSVIFSKLTGRDVMSSNYVGTTVSFTHGKISFKDKEGILIDVPGTYSLEATSQAEEVAVDFLNQGADVIMCVLDATNLERNLNLALQIQEYNIPVVFSLNFMDVAEQQGIHIDIKKLEKELNAPVISTVAVRNIGLRDLIKESMKLAEEFDSSCAHEMENSICDCTGKMAIGKKLSLSQDDRWIKIGKIADKVQHIEDREPTFLEKLGDMTLKPFPGIFIAILVLIASLGIVVGLGKALRAAIFLPILNGYIVPFLTNIVSKVVSEGMIFNVLVGEYGLLVKGIEWPFALILPYVFLFYIVLSFLEDSGYLPRLGVLVDGILRRLGIHGGNIVPFIMGYGCAVPAILGTRASTSHKERIIVASLVSLAVPCVAQTGAFISLLGEHSVLLLILVYMISFLTIVVAGVVLNKIIPGKSDPILLEIPNLLKPDFKSMFRKIWIRTKSFMIEAEIPMLLGIAFAALVAETGILNSVSKYVSPIVTGWLGLPKEATLGLILGVIRRELAVLPLLEMNLSTLQLLVGSVVALFYIPCLSVVGVLIKEFKLKIALAISFSTIILAFLFGGIINQVSKLFMGLI